MAEETQVPVAPIGPQYSAQQTLRPHRGTLILVLGILGLVCCFICGIVAWVMGSSAGRQDLRHDQCNITNPGICTLVFVNGLGCRYFDNAWIKLAH